MAAICAWIGARAGELGRARARLAASSRRVRSSSPMVRPAGCCTGRFAGLEPGVDLRLDDHAGAGKLIDPDKLYAAAMRRAAGRFGGKIIQERVFEDTGGARRSDSGLVQIQSQIPLFTQSAPDYDVLIAADESQVFAPYLPYRTSEPRPVAGSAGLVPTSWDASHDQWGATQLQNRFRRSFSRRMTALDMQAWTAARMIGEAVEHVQSADAQRIFDFIKGPDFALAAFKGRKLTVRDWDLQLRQPILLADGRVVVSVSPQEGFLHQYSELDTLGIDRPETTCRLK